MTDDDQSHVTATPGDEASGDSASSEHHDASAAHADAETPSGHDDHGHAEEHLGPIDWGAWGAAVIGAAMALVVVALFWMAVY